MSALYALNLFDLAPNDDYKAYSKRSADAVGKHGGRVVALGRLSDDAPSSGGTPRQVMVLVEWPSAEAFAAFKDDPDHVDLHPLREGGTENYLWWAYDRLEDLRPVVNDRGGPLVSRINDVGGMTGFPEIVEETDEPAFHADWEAHVFALNGLLLGKGYYDLDEFRDAVERIPPGEFLASGYYERWFAAITTLLAEKGVATREELAGG